MTDRVAPSGAGRRQAGAPYEQIVIEAVAPSVDDGRFPVKSVAGDVLRVEATAFRHGHERVRAAIRAWRPGAAAHVDIPMALVNPGLDRWAGGLPLDGVGRHRFTIVAWTDVFASWVEELRKRIDAAQPDVVSEIAEGIGLVERMASALEGDSRRVVTQIAGELRAAAPDAGRVLAVASSDRVLALMAAHAPRYDEAVYEPPVAVTADRPLARAGAWYELFVRSQSPVPGHPGTFRDASARLADIARMGFDVVYLAPIHPIGRTGRKGKNNSLEAGPDDPGSPWAIGSAAGGHTAVEPALGTLEDFDAFVAEAAAHGLEVALDFAVQCSPDHPWVREHPDWFYRRADGTIRYAENPPKKYQDIYPINFDTADWRNLWDALRDVVRFWIGHGVRIFRVDNPHTKPIGFWAWLIDSIQADTPEAIFLAEAFTRPPMMQALAKRGFTQSYTYFTWRNSKVELTEYLTELTGTGMAWYFRPNFFANTPDILPPILQDGGPAAFKLRLVLAATLSPTYGIYSGYELCEAAAIPGREEYLDSEKYEIRTRDWQAPGNLTAFITRLNEARRRYPALQQFINLQFLTTDNDQVLAYAKRDPGGSPTLIGVVNLDPFTAQTATVHVPPEAVGATPGSAYHVVDVLTGARYSWAEQNWVRLDPLQGEPAHLLAVELAP